MFACGGTGDDVLHIIGSYIGGGVTGPGVPVLSGETVSRTSDIEAIIGFTTSEDGTAYYLVQDAGDPDPMSGDVKNGTKITSPDPVSGTESGIFVVLTAGAKDIYVVVENAAGVSNPLLISVPAYDPGDITAPVLSNERLVDRSSDTKATIEFETDEIGTTYYLEYNTSATAPTKEDVRNGTKSLGSADPNGKVIKEVDLTAGDRNIYVVVEDGAGNISNMLTIYAPAYDPPPVLTNGSVQRTSHTNATIGFTTSEAGTAYYLVYNKDATAPTSAQVKGGTKITPDVPSGTVSGQAIVLTAGAKDIYVVVEDAAGNISSPLKIEAAIFDPPVLSAGSVTRIGNTNATIKFDTTKGGTAYYLVKDSGDLSPTTSTDVRNGVSIGTVPSGTVSGKAVSWTIPGPEARDIYVVVVDMAGNISEPYKIPAADLPVLSNGTAKATSDTTAIINFDTSKAGTAYYLVKDAGATAPTSADVRNGISIGLVPSGKIDPLGVGVSWTLPAGDKDIYVVVEDAAVPGNISISEPYKIFADQYDPGIFGGMKFEGFWKMIAMNGVSVDLLGDPMVENGYYSFFGNEIFYNDRQPLDFSDPNRASLYLYVDNVTNLLEVNALDIDANYSDYVDVNGIHHDFSAYDFSTTMADYHDGYFITGTWGPRSGLYESAGISEGDPFEMFIFFNKDDDEDITMYFYMNPIPISFKKFEP